MPPDKEFPFLHKNIIYLGIGISTIGYRAIFELASGGYAVASSVKLTCSLSMEIANCDRTAM